DDRRRHALSPLRRPTRPARRIRKPRSGGRRAPDRHQRPDGRRDHQAPAAVATCRRRADLPGGRRAALAAALGDGRHRPARHRDRLVGAAMNDDSDIYLAFIAIFALCSVTAVGSATSTVTEMHRQVVDLHGWIGDRTFSELFAIAQAAPGPNVVFVALLGDYIAGVPGAL